MVLHLKNSFLSLKINYLMYFFKTGSFRPNQSRLDRFRSVTRFIRWTGPVTGSGFKNIAKTRNHFGKFHPDEELFKKINPFNEFLKSKLRKIKILMGIKKNKDEKLLKDEDQPCFNLSC